MTNLVDLFAGAGGWSHGRKLATGREPLVAVNHCDHAIHLHRLNHPGTEHWPSDVWKTDPLVAVRGRQVDWLHGSPDCTHFSRAKGGKPRDQKIRALADVLIDWARACLPPIFSLENVVEWLDWGPLDANGDPIKARKGELFREWLAKLQALGYVVEWRVLCAADYGTPQKRNRLFLIGRRDGQPIRWPAPTHADPRKRDLFSAGLRPWRTAAECIDWSIPCPSIFERKRPLAPATCRRIAAGIVRFVLNGQPFIIDTGNGERPTQAPRARSVHEPMRTVTAKGSQGAVVTPVLVETAHGDFAKRPGKRTHRADTPIGVVTGSNNHALVAASLATLRGTSDAHVHGDDVDAPLRTVAAGGTHHALVAAFLAQHYGGMVGKPMGVPTPTVTARDHNAVVACHLTQFRGGSNRNRSLRDPMPTITSGAGSKRPAGAAHATGVVAATLLANNSNNAPQRAGRPLGTVTTGSRHYLVASFLQQYYSSGGQHSRANAPLPTVVTKARHGLVTVTIDGTTYVVVDIGMRMLKPHELKRAQGFPDDYIITGTQEQQNARIGNSVPPQFAQAIVAANTDPREEQVA